MVAISLSHYRIPPILIGALSKDEQQAGTEQITGQKRAPGPSEKEGPGPSPDELELVLERKLMTRFLGDSQVLGRWLAEAERRFPHSGRLEHLEWIIDVHDADLRRADGAAITSLSWRDKW